MAHGHGDEPPEKGTIHAGQQPAQDRPGHGHSAEPKFDIIPEGSVQDKLLVCAAIAALLLLLLFGYNMATAQLPEAAQQSSAR